MNKTEHDKICSDIRRGKRRNLEHQITHRHGTILACTEDGFDVSVDGSRSHWATGNTEPEK